jgi:hypothetical protein
MNLPQEIKNYYKICAIDRDRDGVIPMVDQIDKKALNILIPENQQKIYFRERNGVYTVRENIIGAGSRPNIGNVRNKFGGKKILMICE